MKVTKLMKKSANSSCCEYEKEIERVVAEHHRFMDDFVRLSDQHITEIFNENRRLSDSIDNLTNELTTMRRFMVNRVILITLLSFLSI